MPTLFMTFLAATVRTLRRRRRPDWRTSGAS